MIMKLKSEVLVGRGYSMGMRSFNGDYKITAHEIARDFIKHGE